MNRQLAREERERQDDLAFLAELREADFGRLRQLALNLSFGGPVWMKIAVERALDRFTQRVQDHGNVA